MFDDFKGKKESSSYHHDVYAKKRGKNIGFWEANYLQNSAFRGGF
jgi:hypothetical protein